MRRFCSIFLLLLGCCLAGAQARFVNYGSEEGLNAGSVYAIAQDADGFLWVGTRGGLYRFDGARFHFSGKPVRVTALTVDKENHLFVGTARDNVRALMTDSDGFVWATIGDSTLVKYSWKDGWHEELRTWYDKRYHEGDYPYFQLFEDSEGNIRPAGRIVRNHYFTDRNNPRIVYPFGREGGTCIGSYAEVNGTLYGFDDHTSELCRIERSARPSIGRLPVAHARLLTDHEGRFWAAGSGGLGLINLEKPEETVVYRHDADDPHSLASQELYCIFEDREGNLWVGGDNGLSVLCPALQQVQCLDIPSRQITALMASRDGKLWVGTADNGAFILSLKGEGVLHAGTSAPYSVTAWRIPSPEGQINTNGRVSALYEDRNGTIYIGLWNNTGFLIRENGRTRKGVVSGPIPEAQAKAASGDRITSNWIADFLEDSRGRFWVVTWEGVGLNEWDRKTGRTLPPEWLSPFWYPSAQEDSAIYLSSRLGTRLIEDADGNWVFGTSEAGFNIIDKDSGLATKYYKGNSSIPDDYVSDLCIAPTGELWAATHSGLWSPSGAHFLDGKLVQSLRFDRSGRLWAGTEDGLWFIEADGSAGRAGKALGFPSDLYAEKAACILPDGRLAFGGTGGAAVFHPDNLLASGATGDLFLTDFIPDGTSLRFAFSVRNLPHAALLQYRYRISGVDREWISASFPNLEGRYNGLFPGHYALEIQCTDFFGRWQEPVFTHAFRIRPALLLRWPFMLLYLLLVGGAVWLLVRYLENRQRAKLLQEELDTRNRFFGIVSHDLRGPVSGIRNLASELEKAPDGELRDGVKAIGGAARHTSALLENLLMWSVNQKGVLVPVRREVPLAALVEEAAAGRPVRTEIPEGLTLVTDPNMLTTCLRNLLDNAFKVSPEEVRLQASATHIVITDHGPGMPEEVLQTLSRPGHLGLVITRELLEKLGASLQARNLPEGGCEITITL